MLAYVWDATSRGNMGPDDMERRLEDASSAHSQLVYNKRRSPAGVSDRDFLGRMVWKKEANGFIVVTAPEESEMRRKRINTNRAGVKTLSSHSRRDRTVRGANATAIRISPINDEFTKIHLVMLPDLGGGYQALFGKHVRGHLTSGLAYATEIQEYFLQLRDEYDKADGRALGYRRECHPPVRAKRAQTSASDSGALTTDANNQRQQSPPFALAPPPFLPLPPPSPPRPS